MRFARNLARLVLMVLALFLALSAFGGGIGLMTGLNTRPVQDLGSSIFRDYTAPGLALLVLVGGGGPRHHGL